MTRARAAQKQDLEVRSTLPGVLSGAESLESARFWAERTSSKILNASRQPAREGGYRWSNERAAGQDAIGASAAGLSLRGTLAASRVAGPAHISFPRSSAKATS